MGERSLKKNNLFRKIIAIGLSFFLVGLISFVLIPQAKAVSVHPGKPDDRSVFICNSVTFENVKLTIRNGEQIPIDSIEFSIFDRRTHQPIAYVLFYVDGTEIEEYPSGKFSVTLTSPSPEAITKFWDYGLRWGIDEKKCEPHEFGYGYGYGYGEDIDFLYNIVYTTHLPGIFYAKLFVNSEDYTFQSWNTARFRVRCFPRSTLFSGTAGLDGSSGVIKGIITSHPWGYKFRIIGCMSFGVDTYRFIAKLCNNGEIKGTMWYRGYHKWSICYCKWGRLSGSWSLSDEGLLALEWDWHDKHGWAEADIGCFCYCPP
jgi:hypothetical protein